MFERYITDVLTTYFGQYIQNVDTDKIRLSAWNGRLMLQDVQLRSDCLQRLFHSSAMAEQMEDRPSCPVEIVHGHIGHLELQIPWTLLRTQILRVSSKQDTKKEDASNHISIRLSQVDILIAPIRHSPSDSGNPSFVSSAPKEEEENDVTRQQHIQAAIDAALLRRVALSSSSSQSSPHPNTPSSSSSWKQRLQERVQSIFSNVAVTIEHIHVRYEDAGNCLGFVASPIQHRPPLAIGITLREFSIPPASRRAVTHDLAAYWDSDVVKDRAPEHFYLLDPFSPSLQLACGTAPALHIFCPPCRWNISKHLLEDLGYLRQSVSLWKQRAAVLPEALERPGKFAPRAYWHYAYRAVRPRRRGWWDLAQALGRRRRYVQLYKEFVCGDSDQRRMVHEELLRMERTLSVEEIVAFRIFLYPSIAPEDQGIVIGDDDVSDRDANAPDRILTIDHRWLMFREMIAALDRVQENQVLQQKQLDLTSRDDASAALVLSWTISLQCVELSLQVHDSLEIHGRTRRALKNDSVPVVMLSCAFDQQQEHFQCGSWNTTFRAGSLFVKDCNARTDQSPFAHLIGLQQNASLQPIDTFEIDGTIHDQMVWVQVNRHKRTMQNDVIASRTETNIRILPLEMVYSTAPIESLNHVLTAANVNFSDDYHRIANRISLWKDRQQKRFLNALAHKQKQIFVNVVIGAPVFLFPDDQQLDSSMVVIDLGTLLFSNAGSTDQLEYDDTWLLKMTDVQVKSMLVHEYLSTSNTSKMKVVPMPPHFIIEPFSLNFDLSTKVQSSESGTANDSSAVLLEGNLPRLAVNLKSSVVGLLIRLRRQWMILKNDRRILIPTKMVRRIDVPNSEPGIFSRRIEVRFIAPIFSIKFENDGCRSVGDVKSSLKAVPLFDFALKGIEGSIIRFASAEVVSTTFSAKVCALVAVDLYQSAGEEFLLLLSSVSPTLVGGISRTNFLTDQFSTGTNLVSFEYSSKTDLHSDKDLKEKPLKNSKDADRLLIKFHELFVEWNPETIAMISAALSFPNQSSETENTVSKDRLNGHQTAPLLENDFANDEEFFDAEEDAFFDAESVVSCDTDSRLLSEISESERSSVSDFVPSSPLLGPLSSFAAVSGPLTVMQSVTSGSPWSGRNFQPLLRASITDGNPLKSFIVAFELSKLSVNFNKESRRRRLITAEMDKTEVQYDTMGGFGSKILLTIGNLTFSDCESFHNNTLYREILGLQTEGLNMNGEHSSLLEMEMITKPRLRKYVSFDEIDSDPTVVSRAPVYVDTDKGSILGFDNHLKARFSPMRFVYLQQLWFEIVDYFFTAIVGYEVWGDKTPIPGDTSMLSGMSIAADQVPFTLFDVLLLSPIILIPVSSCSTHFIRLAASSVSLTNRYSFERMRPASLCFRGDGVNRQWYNNCSVEIEKMALSSWSGSVLDRIDERPSAKLSISWPVGPSAPVNVPKWKFDCNVEAMHLFLDREDYALVQHVVQHNIGGVSLHLDEWNLLHSLSPTARDLFFGGLLVQFPYDKKDTTPSTFDMTVAASKIIFSFMKSEDEDVAVVRCSDVVWKYEKLLDRVTKQRVACSFDVLESLHGKPVLSSISEESGTLDEIVFPTLSYSSITQPSLNNDKNLVISDACIDTIYPFWMKFGEFFQNLPLPVYLSPNEAIQVGDRWYKIVEHSHASNIDASRRLRWIQELGPSVVDGSVYRSITSPTFSFLFSLVRPAIRICSGVSAVVLSIERCGFSHFSRMSQISRTMNFHGVELLTRTLGKMRRSSEFSLIRPWSIDISMAGCQNGHSCTCLSHSLHASVGLLQARAAYSDIAVVLDSFILFNRDIRSFRVPTQLDNGKKPFESKQESHSQSSAFRHEQKRDLSLDWEGFRLVVADDTGRHFVGDQDLVVVFFQDISLSRRHCDKAELLDHSNDDSSFGVGKISTHFRVQEVDVIDCLQSEQSPFRKVLSLKSLPVTQINLRTATSESVSSECDFALEIWGKENENKEYGIEFGAVEIQYNPSFVVALQRFLGRFMKEAKARHGDLFENSTRGVSQGNTLVSTTGRSTLQHAFISRTNILVRYMLISLNKEHQKRRLLKMSVSRILIEFELCAAYYSISGHICAFSAFDPMGIDRDMSEVVVRSSSSDHRFIEFVYKFFPGRLAEISSTCGSMPSWILSRLKNDDMIDDYLDVSVSSLDFVYLKERTAELLDYLSSGMPGKGMGATSRAAKGFVKERIQKRSYARVKLGAPRIFIPRNHSVDSYILLRFVDLSLTTWIALNEDSSQNRKIEVYLAGFCIDMCRSTEARSAESTLMSKVDVEVDVELSSVATSTTCHLSDVMTHLSYNEYVVLRYIIQDNIGKKTNRDLWDNLERAWENESEVSDTVGQDSLTYSVHVAYSSSARVVRYGQGIGKRPVTLRKKFMLSCGNIALVLSKDASSSDSDVLYDMIGIHVHRFDFEVGRKEDGEEWLSLSLGSIFVVDLGKDGRCLGMNDHRSENRRQVDSLSVLVEGYNSSQSSISKSTADSHLVVKVDRNSGTLGDVNIVIIVSFLSVTLFRGPLQDLMSFAACKWTSTSSSSLQLCSNAVLDDMDSSSGSTDKRDDWFFPFNFDIKIRFVSHYARFVLAADELDPHSRSLMVKGLSIANATFRPLKTDSGSLNGTALSLNADFQDVSSHMIPDIAKIVGIQRQHIVFMKKILPSCFLEQSFSTCDEGAFEEFVTPLLLPLTFSIEYEQETAHSEPISRSVAISVDPLSVFLSHEDVNLLRAVVFSWSSQKKSEEEKIFHSRISMYDVSFNTERLGLGLRKENGRVVVDNVADARNNDIIQTGDYLFAINDVEIVDAPTMTLSDMVSLLASKPRPLTLTFAREIPTTVIDNKAQVSLDAQTRTRGFVDNVTFSMSSSVITLVEKELPLLRGSLSTTKFSCYIVRSTTTALKTELSSGISIDYYNLRIWGWEPFVDPGVVFFSSTYQDAHHGPRELAIEVGDREAGLSINITDSLMRSLCKMLDWNSAKLGDNIDEFDNFFLDEAVHSIDTESSTKMLRDIVSRKAAVAAFQFAFRQKLGTAKPFIFRNRTGVSVAFAIKKGYLKLQTPSQPAVSVGDFSGFEHLESSDVVVLTNGEDLKCRIDVTSNDTSDGRTKALFPAFTVALQRTSGVAVQPFENLQTSRQDEHLLSLLFDSDIGCDLLPPIRPWMSWSVEQSDEVSVITVGSSIRLISLCSQAIEVGIAVDTLSVPKVNDSSVMSLGMLREGTPFPLPLWIAMQRQSWVCYLKLRSGYYFAPLFVVSPDGCVTKATNVLNGFIECQPTRETGMSSWLSVNMVDEGGVLLVHIDGSVSIRNLLPISVDWELAHDDSNTVDGSTVRDASLQSGEEVEVLTKDFSLAKIRLRPLFGDFSWSSWESLSLSQQRETVHYQESSSIDENIPVHEEAYGALLVKDVFSFPLLIGIRIASKTNGIDVTLYADLWCVNCTSFDILFGSPLVCASQEDSTTQVSKPFKDLSVAEATLKEISALFETDTFMQNSDNFSCEVYNDIVRIPGQVSPIVVEECFEYVEVGRDNVIQRWWASENPFSPRDRIYVSEGEVCKWIDKTWKMDDSGKTFEGWESSVDLEGFLSHRTFNACHKYRRRRWIRSHHGASRNSMIEGANAFFQLPKITKQNPLDKKTELIGIQLAVQVNGGRWSPISAIPRQGSAHGVVRVNRARWPNAAGELSAVDSFVFELCYSVSPLDGDWGLLTRSLTLTSRFLLRNDSRTISFEVKQTGASDTSAVIIRPGHTEPFHWGNCRLPELVSVRPSVRYKDRCIYKWSGGFDPLVIGHLALRIRRVLNLTDQHEIHVLSKSVVRAIKAEVEIRPQTGGTGIKLSFREEEDSGFGALYRIENLSPFPIWFCQDDVLSNPSRKPSEEDQTDIVHPSSSTVFALDIPFKQGKYAHRKALSFSALLRVRLALSPFSTRAGIETTKVVSMAAGDAVRLNPSKLMILSPELRNVLQDVRVIGGLINDGPTRVLRLRLMAFNSSDVQLWPYPASISWHDDLSSALQEVVHGAVKAADMRRLKVLPSEEIALQRLLSSEDEDSLVIESTGTLVSNEALRNLIVSFRVSFGGLMVSLVDSAPAEIALATFKNINAIATWDYLRVTNSTVYITIESVQVDNMVPNSPFPVAVSPIDHTRINYLDESKSEDDAPPLLVVGLSFAPKHKSGILCLKSVTIAPRNLSIKVDLAFLVRLQKFALDLRDHFHTDEKDYGGRLRPPVLNRQVASIDAVTDSGSTRRKIFLGGLTILPCNVKLSVAPARALTTAQAALEGEETAAIHQAVRKGDVRLDRKSVGILGVKIGSRNKTPLAVVRGLFKSFIVDGLLRLDGASLNFAGVSLRNHTSTRSQLTTALTAHYIASLRQNLPAVLGSLAAFGNPLGLVRGLGEGVGDFVLEPVKGFQRSVQEMDASYLVDGVARGTLSLARHTVGGFADSAAMLAETFSKNMAVLTLDRNYAQKRDRDYELRDNDDLNVASGLGSGVQKLVNGFLEGVTGVVKAPIRGAEKHGFEGFAKGIGKGLLGLLVKPIIGISDGFTDVMIGVKGSVEGVNSVAQQIRQVRPRRALYGPEKAIRSFVFADAAASALMLRTSLAGESYLSHFDLGDRLILIGCKRMIMLGRQGEELFLLRLKHIDKVEIRGLEQENSNIEWGVVIFLNTPRRNGNEVEVIVCNDKLQAEQLSMQLDHGRNVALNL